MTTNEAKRANPCELWILGFLMAVAGGCAGDELRPGVADGTFSLTGSADSSADGSSFVVGEGALNADDVVFQILYIDPTKRRSIRIDIERSLVQEGATLDRTVEYFEAPGVNEQWSSDVASPNGLITIRELDDAGFSFSVAPHRLIPSGTDAVGILMIEGQGQVALRQ